MTRRTKIKECPQCGTWNNVLRRDLCRKCNGRVRGSGASACSLDGVVREFIRLLDIEEESDSGRRFRPNGITSCRAVDGEKMVELLQEMKRLTENEEN